MKCVNLYLSNSKNLVEVRLGNKTITYIGPKNLVRFYKINKIDGNTLYVDTVFSYLREKYIEEDYIDLEDILGVTEKEANKILNSIENTVVIREKGDFKMGKITRMQLIDSALLVSDNIALLPMKNKDTILAISMAKTNMRAIIELNNIVVLKTNMSNTLLDRTIKAVTRNISLIKTEITERKLCQNIPQI